ncbi:SNF2-related protein [Streptococcus sobrinus]|uniref:SNF2-related protein n=1 Tax=Streptococcus sobrinus TaxID=1310 RepID=UPI0020D22E97|nr:SNF2-related protein [Streptococcus sobrinus]
MITLVFSQELKNNIKPVYQSKRLVHDFYEPAFSEAKVYKRVSAYFSSEGLELYAKGIDKLFNNGGIAQFIISTDISEEDFSKIKAGYELKESLDKLANQLRSTILNKETKEKLGNLAFMIARGQAEVKFALIPVGRGLFHDKFGLIESDEETIFFNGSVNETRNGLELNYESISVDVSWDNSEHVQKRISTNANRFEQLWNNQEEEVITVEATKIVYSELKKYQGYSTITSVKEGSTNFEGVCFQLAGRKTVIRKDNSAIQITQIDRKLRPDSDLSNKYFEEDNSTIKPGFSYRDIENIIKITKTRCDRRKVTVAISEEVVDFLQNNRYSIEEYRKLGAYLKFPNQYELEGEKERYKEFAAVVSSEVVRPFKDLQLSAAFYEYRMARVANFSVPGSGKTSMILAVFAYLNSQQAADDFVDKLLVISPINAFNSWKEEFEKVFGYKKQLKTIDCQSAKDFDSELRITWGSKNLVLVNYEALPKYESQLQDLITSKTMVVFDEVHRIKNPMGKRANAALSLVDFARFKFVLTGTPIPNSYVDIYNFLHLLYGNEYNSFFGWTLDELKQPKMRKIDEINQTLLPFFWRINKDDLGVPKPDSDYFIVEEPSEIQRELAESIYYNEKSSLARLIRLVQASTNPELLSRSISYEDMDFNDEEDTVEILKSDFEQRLNDYSDSVIKEAKLYSEYNFSDMVSPKFEAGIEKIKELVSEGKKVIVWAIFVDTMKKIQKRLNSLDIKTSLVYGGTDVSERQVLIDNFKTGSTMVMVSNPQTLGEAVSLHETIHDAVYFEYNFNLTFMLQSRDRIHRLGLPENQYTRYYYLQTQAESPESGRAGYIDEQIYKALKKKEDVMYKAIDNNRLDIEFPENEIEEAIKIIDKERQRIQKNRK